MTETVENYATDLVDLTDEIRKKVVETPSGGRQTIVVTDLTFASTLKSYPVFNGESVNVWSEEPG